MGRAKPGSAPGWAGSREWVQGRAEGVWEDKVEREEKICNSLTPPGSPSHLSIHPFVVLPVQGDDAVTYCVLNADGQVEAHLSVNPPADKTNIPVPPDSEQGTLELLEGTANDEGIYCKVGHFCFREFS